MQLTNITDIQNYLRGGHAEFTLRSVKSGAHHTYRLSNIPNGSGFFASHLTGSDNENDFSYLCIVPGDLKKTIYTKASPKNSEALPALDWFLRCLDKASPKLAAVEFYHTGKCSVCGRKLTTPESIERGIGPVCMERI